MKMKMKSFIYKIKEIRNGFDHAWTAQSPEEKAKMEEVLDIAKSHLNILKQIVNKLIDNKIVVD